MLAAHKALTPHQQHFRLLHGIACARHCCLLGQKHRASPQTCAPPLQTCSGAFCILLCILSAHHNKCARHALAWIRYRSLRWKFPVYCEEHFFFGRVLKQNRLNQLKAISAAEALMYGAIPWPTWSLPSPKPEAPDWQRVVGSESFPTTLSQ
jgi:hypothetical protein